MTACYVRLNPSTRLTAEDGTLVNKALDQARETLWREQRDERQRVMEGQTSGQTKKIGPGTPGWWPLTDDPTRERVSAETPEDARA